MRDLIEVERLGVPTVLIVNGPLAPIAVETARAAGMPALAIHSVSVQLIGRPLQEITADALAELSSISNYLEIPLV